MRRRREGVRRDQCTEDEEWGPHGFVANELVWSLSVEAVAQRTHGWNGSAQRFNSIRVAAPRSISTSEVPGAECHSMPQPMTASRSLLID